MFQLLKSLPLLVAGAALYHLSRTMLVQREQRARVLTTRHAEREAHQRLYDLVANACQRGMLNLN